MTLRFGDPGMTRTCDLRFRKPSLYPAELRDRSPAGRRGRLDAPYQSGRVIASLRFLNSRHRVRIPAARCTRVLLERSAQQGVSGNAGCPLHPQPRARSVESTRVSHHGRTGTPGIPARDGFNGFLRTLPGDRALLSPSPPRSLLLKNLTPTIEASGPHDFAVRKITLSSAAQLASIASLPYVRDDRETPLCIGPGWREM